MTSKTHRGHGEIELRRIAPSDDAAVADIIRTVMTEFRCNREGFAIHDEEVAAMSRAYPGGPSQYWVVCENGIVLGAGGFGPLAGSPQAEATCELRKMYFRPELRGRQLGERLLTLLLAKMQEAGYRRCYLETTEQMTGARRLYERMGFVARCGALGATGHHGCDRFYTRDLTGPSR